MVIAQATIADLERSLRIVRSQMLDLSPQQLQDTDKLLNDALMAVKLETLSRKKEALNG
jgi:hypothetical protein